MVEEEVFTKIPIKDIAELASTEDNKKCFDCDASPANWFCINNGIYLCATCAGEHRAFGSIISNIKSLILDKFNEYQFELLKISGNKRLKDLLAEYQIENYKEIDKLILFSSKLLEYYRNVLYYKLTGKREPPKIDPEYALEIMDNFRVNTRPQVNKVTYWTEEKEKEAMKEKNEKDNNEETTEEKKEVAQEVKTKEKSDCGLQ